MSIRPSRVGVGEIARGYELDISPGIQNPAVAGLRTPGRQLGGAPYVPHIEEVVEHVWPDPPETWGFSVGEWVVYWYLKYFLKWEEGIDWYHNGRVWLQGFHASNNFTPVDFIIDLGPGTRLGVYGKYTARVLDPITDYTHQNKVYDRERRNALAEEGYDLIFLDWWDLEWRTHHIIPQALRGIDESSRNDP